MSKPRLLDLFCGAGGCTKGYQEAGFYVVGVDINPQPNYCGDEFYLNDALAMTEFDSRPLAATFDAIHASPPCQHYANVTAWRGNHADHADLVGTTRDLLNATGLPWVIENVDGAPLDADFMLCGTMFGLPIRRHRYFETNWAGVETWGTLGPCGHHPEDYSFDHGGKQPESVYRDAMGVPWMTVTESRQAIPPVYSRHIGDYLRVHLASPLNPHPHDRCGVSVGEGR